MLISESGRKKNAKDGNYVAEKQPTFTALQNKHHLSEPGATGELLGAVALLRRQSVILKASKQYQTIPNVSSRCENKCYASFTWCELLFGSQ